MSARRLASVTESWRSAGPFGDAGADRLGQRELAAQVVGLDGADAEVGADGGDPVALAQAGAGGPAVGELRLLVGEREVLALVLLGLDAADLVRARARGRAAARSGCGPAAGRRAASVVAGAGGEQPALAGVEHDVLRRRGGGRCRARAGPWSSACGRAARCPRGRSRGGRWGRARARRARRARACPPGRRARSVVTSNSAGAGVPAPSGGAWRSFRRRVE